MRRSITERQQDQRGDDRDDARRDEVGPPDDTSSCEPVDEHTDERRQQGVGDVQGQDDLQQVVGRGHVLDVEPFLAAERDRLADGALDDALAGLDEELHTHQDREVAVGEHAEQAVEEPSERLERTPQPRIADPERAAERDRDPDDDPCLRRRQGTTPHREHPDPRQQQHHDRHPGDQGNTVDGGADLEPVGREPARDDQQRREQHDHQQALRKVVERTWVIGELLRFGSGGILRLVDDVLRRAPEPFTFDHVDVGSDLDPLRSRVVEGLLLILGRAVLDAVAQAPVVLAEQEHDGVLGVGLQTRNEVFGLLAVRIARLIGTSEGLAPVRDGRVVVPLAPLRRRRGLPRQEVVQRAEVRRRAFDRIAGKSRPEHVGVGLGPAVPRVGLELLIAIAEVHEQHDRTVAGSVHHLTRRRERRSDALLRPLVGLAHPPSVHTVVQEPAQRTEHQQGREAGRHRGGQERRTQGSDQQQQADHDHQREDHPGDLIRQRVPKDPRDGGPHDQCRPRDRQGVGALAATEPADRREGTQSHQRHGRRRCVHEAVVRDRGAGEHGGGARERQ